MGLIARLGRFAARNRGVVLAKARDELLVRAWLRPGLRKVLGHVFPLRTPERWVFMGGCYNSGTTILREILGAHPQIATLPREGVRMTSAFPDLERGGWQRMWHRNAAAGDLSPDAARIAARTAMRDWSPWWARDAHVFLEKSIAHGAWMPALQSGFPGARFIGVIRNGYCAAEGIRRRAQPSGPARAALGADIYPWEEVGRQWVFANEVLLRDRERLTHYHEIRYEAFVTDPLGTVQALCRFLDIDPGVVTVDGSTDTGSQAGTVLIVGGRRFHVADQNPTSIARLDAEARSGLEAVIGPMLDRLGYDRLPPNDPAETAPPQDPQDPQDTAPASTRSANTPSAGAA